VSYFQVVVLIKKAPVLIKDYFTVMDLKQLWVAFYHIFPVKSYQDMDFFR